MTTTLIAILAFCLILLSAAAALLTIRAMRLNGEAEDYAQRLSALEKDLRKKENDLSAWDDKIRGDLTSYYTIVAEAPAKNQLPLKVGSAIVKLMPNSIEQTPNGYRISVYIRREHEKAV